MRRGPDYGRRLRRERQLFAGQEKIHAGLPPSAHYWSERHVRPKFETLGVPSVEALIQSHVQERANRASRDVVVLSLGSGNGDQELGWMRSLADAGVRNVRMRLLEVNPEMQRRAREAAMRLGLHDHFEFLVEDFNTWCADAEHDVVIGFQALHHVVDLEHLYRQIRDSLDPGGVLIVHDMIGRNGHRRWPESLEVVERIWSTLPPELRRNGITGEVDDCYEDIDCAMDGFEGIRAQDVLPVLMDYLQPGFFLAYGSVIDPFVDRVYGGNFRMDVERDRALIERIGVLDDTLLDLGVVTPTRMTATFHLNAQELRVYGDRTPQRSIRDPEALDRAGRVSFDPRAADPLRLIQGAGLVTGRMRGVEPDQWAAPEVELPVLATSPVAGLELATHLPEWVPEPGTVTILVDGSAVGAVEVRHGTAEHAVPVSIKAGRGFRLSLVADWSATPHEEGVSPDRRRLSYVLVSLKLQTA